MIEIHEFKADLAKGMRVRDLDARTEALVCSPAYLKCLESVGPGYILTAGGKPVAAAVFARLLYHGVAEVVVLVSPEIGRYIRAMHRFCKKLIDYVQDTYKFHRIEAKIPESQKRNRRWAESMGFKPEGVCEAFGSTGENFVQYARIRKEFICPQS